MKVLKLSAQGLPQSWISLEQAVIHYAAGEVRWESGGEIAVFEIGHQLVEEILQLACGPLRFVRATQNAA